MVTVFERNGDVIGNVIVTKLAYYDLCASTGPNQEVPEPPAASYPLLVQITPAGGGWVELPVRGRLPQRLHGYVRRRDDRQPGGAHDERLHVHGVGRNVQRNRRLRHAHGPGEDGDRAFQRPLRAAASGASAAEDHDDDGRDHDQPDGRVTGVSRLAGAAALALLLAAGAGPAQGSYLVTRAAARPMLQVDAQGHALVTYTEGGRTKHVLVWGAMNAVAPRASGRQVAFKLDYSGGASSLKKPDYYRSIENVCSVAHYDGPQLPFKVVACKAPDGSYWALQRWQRLLPNLGFAPWRVEQSEFELHVSHWKGPLPEVKATMNWAWGGRYQQIVGTFTYAGSAIYGFRSTPAGAPLDTWGRNVYLDTFDAPQYGPGWKRENSFLVQSPNGRFCYTLGPRTPYNGYPASGPRQGAGQRYRLTADGPGVTPIVSVTVDSAGDWDPKDPAKTQLETQGNALVASLGFAPAQCHQ